MEMDIEKILEEHIKQAREAQFRGSGDDMFYAVQPENYVNEQRAFWIEFGKKVANKSIVELNRRLNENVESFRKGIYDIWFHHTGDVEEKIELCVKLFRRIINPKAETKYNQLLDKYDEIPSYFIDNWREEKKVEP